MQVLPVSPHFSSTCCVVPVESHFTTEFPSHDSWLGLQISNLHAPAAHVSPLGQSVIVHAMPSAEHAAFLPP
jgi:hypothetical protein